MADLIDNALNIVLGLEKKLKGTIDDLASAGRADEAKDTTELNPRKKVENKIVDEGVKTITDLLTLLGDVKDKLEGEAKEAVEAVMDKLKVPSSDDFEAVKEMARIAREKTEELEKRIAKLEK